MPTTVHSDKSSANGTDDYGLIEADLEDKRGIQRQEIKMWTNTIYQLESRLRIARLIAKRTGSDLATEQESSFIKQLENAHHWLEGHKEELASLDTSHIQ